MLGLNGQSWLVEMIRSASPQPLGDAAHVERELATGYSAYFGLGHSIELLDRPGVFKISPAGLALGAHLLKTVDDRDLEGKFLDVGTGSGALAILLRSMGATDITASDVCAGSVALAGENERLNFGDGRIQFLTSDLFSALPRTETDDERYDRIIFNPPGWRTPSPELREELAHIRGDIDPSAMFYGDQILMRFLDELPGFLRSDGRAILGLNSLVGIKNLLHQYKAQHAGAPPLRFRLCERHTFPLLFYSDQWKQINHELRAEFARWRKHHGSAYTVDSQGNLYWSYEVVECQLAENLYV